MTDNEIIKALELHAMDDDNTCDDCDYRACGCSYTLCKDAIDLINRLNIENENYSCNIKQLTSDHITLQNDFENAKSLYVKENKKVNKLNQKLIEICKQLKTAKAEAIKEFAERLKNEAYKNVGIDRDFLFYDSDDNFITFDSVADVIDFLSEIVIKEMVGDTE